MQKVYERKRGIGIKASLEFQKKQLATHGLNVGLMCGHSCLYCSTPAVIRYDSIFKGIGMTSFQAFKAGVAIVDPAASSRVPTQAAKLLASDIVMLSTMTDPYAPEAQAHNLGRHCAEAVLKNSGATLRILTKNSAVAADLDFLSEYRERVLLGLSVTMPPSKEHIAATLEPNASSIAERLAAYRKAREMGIRTYGMLCPCLPGIASSYDDVMEMMRVILDFEPEDIWLEPVNPRGDCLLRCRDALEAAGLSEEAYRVDEIRDANMHQLYVDELVDVAMNVARDLECVERLKILVYADGRGFSCDDTAVIWLNK